MARPLSDIGALARQHGLTTQGAKYRLAAGIPLDAPKRRGNNAKAWATRRRAAVMASIKRLDPMDIRAVVDWLRQTSRYRVLVLRRTAGRRNWALDAYSVTRPDPELEYDATRGGAVVVGYYTRQVDPANVMADIAAAMGEL